MPSLGVIVAILHEDQILLTLRNDLPVWCLPGGGVEPGETMAEAAQREVLEETGVQVRLTRLVGIYSSPLKANGGGHEILFAAELAGGEPRPDGRETVKVEWFRCSDLPKRCMAMHRAAIQDAIQASPAVARRMIVYPTLAKYTRSELYALRDAGKLDLPALIMEVCTPLNETDYRNELEQ